MFPTERAFPREQTESFRIGNVNEWIWQMALRVVTMNLQS
jgi:hypothetical protein